uniref:SSD domain-containing protein n=1 Tax=Rhabditophanes sp. KR3021 TaxID=114890 RepID=A0AC35U847_9BILA
MTHPTHYIEKLFFKLGFVIGKHPYSFIYTISFITIFLSLGNIWFEELNNVRSEYSPQTAPSKNEYDVAKAFLKQNGTMDPCYIMVNAIDEGSLMRPDYRMTLYNLSKDLQDKVTYTKKGITYKFKDLCEPYCELNTAFMAFLKLFDEKDPSTYTYPAIEMFGSRLFIGNNVYGIKLKNETNQLESFDTAIMSIYLVAPNNDVDIIIQWQNEAIKMFKSTKYSDILKIGMTGDNLVSQEVRRMGIETAPLLIGSVIAMIIFVVVFSFRRNPIQNKPWEGLLGCLIPLAALAASIGLLSALGLKFQSIVVASLFLVLSVGVDDIFIINSAWDRNSNANTVSTRMALSLEDAGPSITISALTNIISFAIGAFSDTPAIRTFCIYSAVAILICYLYQLMLYSAILVISGHRERKGYKAFLCCFKADPNKTSQIVGYFSKIHDKVVYKWGSLVTKWWVRLFIFVTTILYFYISTIGIMQLETNNSIDKMALPDSYLQNFQHAFEKALINMQPVSVFVLKPGDLRDTENMEKIKRMVKDFENAKFSYGAESSFFWLQAYQDFLQFYAEDEQFTYTELPVFFKSASYFYLSSFVHYNESACIQNHPDCISAFFFITNFHDVIKYHEMVPAVKDWRRIAEEYKEFEVYPYSDHAPFVDQTLAIDNTIIGSVVAALICTAIICLIFIPHIPSVAAAVFSVFSISYGIFGILSLWNVDLDPLSMAALLMAIGFSVDFTAHISYHYYKINNDNPKKKIQEALAVIGWPMTQVGISTIVALAPLLFKQSYLALVFLKTIIVVVGLGMLHGLVILPAILTAFTSEKESETQSNCSSQISESDRSSQRSHGESFYKVNFGSSNSTHMSSSMASMPSPSSTCSSPCPTKELPKFLLGHHLTSEPLSAPPTKPLGGFFYDKTPEFGDNSYEMSHGNKKSSSASTSESIISHSTDSKNELCRYAWEIQRSLVEFGPKIGSGSFGTVYRGHYCGDVAIKRINTNGEPSEKQLIDFQSEVSILKDMRHGNVLLFMGIVKTPELCIITQWCEGSSLYKHLHVTEPKWELEITKVIDISKQVSNGMGYLHSRKIIHRDLKSNNIFLTADETVKIGDFGLATVKQKFTSESTAKLRPTGSILWMAPEIIRMKVEEPYSFWSDIYAFGIVLYELLTNNLPYAGIDNRDAIFFRVGMGLLKPDLSQLRKNCPKSLRSLLENCIKFKREERPLFPAILGTMENIRQELPKMQKSHSAPLLNRPDDEMIQERNSGKQQHPSTPMYGTRHPYFVASSSRGVDD